MTPGEGQSLLPIYEKYQSIDINSYYGCNWVFGEVVYSLLYVRKAALLATGSYDVNAREIPYLFVIIPYSTCLSAPGSGYGILEAQRVEASSKCL